MSNVPHRKISFTILLLEHPIYMNPSLAMDVRPLVFVFTKLNTLLRNKHAKWNHKKCPITTNTDESTIRQYSRLNEYQNDALSIIYFQHFYYLQIY